MAEKKPAPPEVVILPSAHAPQLPRQGQADLLSSIIPLTSTGASLYPHPTSYQTFRYKNFEIEIAVTEPSFQTYSTTESRYPPQLHRHPDNSLHVNHDCSSNNDSKFSVTEEPYIPLSRIQSAFAISGTQRFEISGVNVSFLRDQHFLRHVPARIPYRKGKIIEVIDQPHCQQQQQNHHHFDRHQPSDATPRARTSIDGGGVRYPGSFL